MNEYLLIGPYLNCRLSYNATTYGRGIIPIAVALDRAIIFIYGIGGELTALFVCGQTYGIFTCQYTTISENEPIIGLLAIGKSHLPQPADHLRHSLHHVRIECRIFCRGLEEGKLKLTCME